MRSSSSRSKYKCYTKEELIARTNYDCPLPIKMEVHGSGLARLVSTPSAWTITNPGRRFKGCPIFDEDAKCHFYGFLDAELPSEYYKELFFKIHEENKMLKNMAKNMCKHMTKNMIKSNSDGGGILEMGELKEEFTLIKSKLQMYDEGGILEMGKLNEELILIKSKLQMNDKVVVVLVILVRVRIVFLFVEGGCLVWGVFVVAGLGGSGWGFENDGMSVGGVSCCWVVLCGWWGCGVGCWVGTRGGLNLVVGWVGGLGGWVYRAGLVW
ncbi:hypothetical protein Tco_0285464 [Tanacetum coccineum]